MVACLQEVLSWGRCRELGLECGTIEWKSQREGKRGRLIVKEMEEEGER